MKQWHRKWGACETTTTLKMRTRKMQKKKMLKMNNNINSDDHRKSGNANQPATLL
jgi:S-adenosylhomocysteine hydrolase